MERKVTISRHALVPRGPNRIVAHRRNGNGAYSDTGAVLSPAFCPLKTKIEIASSPAPSTAPSTNRFDGAARSSFQSGLVQLTIAGTSVIDARTLERYRVRHSCQ